MPNNSPSLFWRFNFQTTYLPPTCHLPPTCVSLPPSQQPTPKPICHPQLQPRRCSFVTASRPATLINAHHRLTTLPLSPFCPSFPRGRPLSLAPSLPFSSRFLRPRRTFCSSQLFNNFADRELKQGDIRCDRKLYLAAVFADLVFCYLSSKFFSIGLERGVFSFFGQDSTLAVLSFFQSFSSLFPTF
jgi:hypothetical protein